MYISFQAESLLYPAYPSAWSIISCLICILQSRDICCFVPNFDCAMSITIRSFDSD